MRDSGDRTVGSKKPLPPKQGSVHRKAVKQAAIQRGRGKRVSSKNTRKDLRTREHKKLRV